MRTADVNKPPRYVTLILSTDTALAKVSHPFDIGRASPMAPGREEGGSVSLLGA